MLEDHLGLALALHQHHEAVKALDAALELEPVHQKDGDDALLPAGRGEKLVLLIRCFLHGLRLLFPAPKLGPAQCRICFTESLCAIILHKRRGECCRKKKLIVNSE